MKGCPVKGGDPAECRDGDVEADASMKGRLVKSGYRTPILPSATWPLCSAPKADLGRVLQPVASPAMRRELSRLGE